MTMPVHEPPSLLLLGSESPLAVALDAWLRPYLAGPLIIGAAHTLPEALGYFRDHRVDLVLADADAAQQDLHAIHTASPTTAIISIVPRIEPANLLHILRQGTHEALCLLPSMETDPSRTIAQALARVNGRTSILRDAASPSSAAATPPRLIHDLNNLLTSINGFADLLLHQLPPDHPAHMGAEQIRLAGKRAATLLKTHAPSAAIAPPSSSSSAAPSITTRAA